VQYTEMLCIVPACGNTTPPLDTPPAALRWPVRSKAPTEGVVDGFHPAVNVDPGAVFLAATFMIVVKIVAVVNSVTPSYDG
jgi:hypothetical protein